jgi:hypothetical protein
MPVWGELPEKTYKKTPAKWLPLILMAKERPGEWLRITDDPIRKSAAYQVKTRVWKGSTPYESIADEDFDIEIRPRDNSRDDLLNDAVPNWDMHVRYNGKR